MKNVLIRYVSLKLCTAPGFLQRSILLSVIAAFFSIGIISAQCTVGCNQSTTSNSMPGTNNFSNTFCITTASTLTYNQNFDMNGGTVCVGPNVAFNAGGGNYNGNWTINNYGSFSRSITLNSGQTFNNYGTFTGSVSLNGGTIVNYSGAVFTPSSFNFNGGSFTNNTGGTATFSSSVIVNSGATFISYGTLSVAGITLNSSAAATLAGNTTINGNVSNNGTISTGGLITVTGNYNQNSSGSLTSIAGSQCNALNVTGSIQGQGTYNGVNGLLLNKALSAPSCTSCLINGASTTPPGAPASQVNGPTLTAAGNNISGTITNPGGSPAATHYIVLRRFGTAVSDQPADYINYSVGNTIGSSTVVAVNAISTLTFTDANVISSNGCGTYHYAVFPYNASGSCGTYNRTVNATNRSSITIASTGGTVASSATICASSASGTLTLSGNIGAVTRWEYALSPFTAWTTVSNTTNSYSYTGITQTTQFRAVVNAGSGCSNANAAAATITLASVPAAPSGTGATRCGNGTLTLSATAASGETIDWYAAASGGTALATGSTSYTTSILSATTTFYAAARNTTSGCVSASRTAVIATVNPSPSISLSNFSAVCSGTTSTTLTYTSPVNSPDQYSIDWSSAANAAGLSDVSWTALSGGTITITGLISTAGNYAANIYVRNSTTGCQTDVSNGSAVTCGTATENGTVTLTAPGSGVFSAINFASYGTPNGSCGAFTTSTCHSSTSVSVVQAAALGNNSFTLTANNATFGDPCVGTTKRLYIEAVSSLQILTIAAIPTVTSATGTSRCGGGSVTITAAASSGATIDWYASASGGTALATGTPSYTTTLSGTTTFYAEARNTTAGCVSTSRTAVTATITTLPSAPTGTGASRCGNGTVTVSANMSGNITIDWYAAASGGTALATASSTYTTGTLSTTTTYYAEARNIITGCVSTTRTAVTATVNPSPSVTLSNFSAICAGTTSTSLTYTSPVNSPDQYSINWSAAANAAGLNDVSWTTLSGGTIPVTGLISTAGNYSANIYVRNSTTGCQTDVSNGSAITCGTAAENATVTLTAPGSGLFTAINFASYGTPNGSCGSFTTGTCHASTSLTVVQNAALGNNSFTLTANNGTFGDPCSGTIKRLYIEAVSSLQTLTILAAPTVTASAGASRCSTGSVTLSATPSTDAAIDWYAAATGGSALSTGSNTYTTASLSGTTIFYAEARNTTTGCIALSRTAVTATVNSYPAAPVAVNNSRCGTGTVTIQATPGSGETIDWYAASSGGTVLSSGSISFTTPSISAATTYYAESRNITTGCISPARTAVTASINAVPSVTLSNFPSICAGTSSTTLTYSDPVNSPDQYYIDWNSTANTAGLNDVNWTTLSGGAITINGLISTAGSYGATVYVRNSTTGCQSDVSNGTTVTCGTTGENTSVTLTAPTGALFNSINFASYGTPNGSCGSFTLSSCHSSTSTAVVQAAAIGRNSFSVSANNTVFGDPCSGTGKRLYIEAVSNTQVLIISALPTITASSPATRCGSGSITISATPSSGAAVDWYAAASGGTALTTGSNSYTTTLSSTTSFFAQARNTTTGCLSAARTAVTATITLPTISSFSPVNAGPGMSVVITGSNFTGATAVSFGGTAATSFTVNSATQITAVLAAGSSGNVSVTTGCGSATLAGFTFYPAPTITTFAPASGYIGNTVTITGTNFTGATAVSFGGTAATSFTVVSPTTITAVLSTGTTGSVAVTTPGGTATRTGFTYIQATVWTGTLSNSWSTAGNWNNGVPSSSSLVVIPPVETYPTINSSQAIAALTMDTAAQLTVAGSTILSITGNFINNGTTLGSGSISMAGSSAQTISGTGHVKNIIINNTAGVSISSGTNRMTVTGTLTPTAGTLATNGNLTLKSDATGSAMVAQGAASGNYINGTVSWERYIPGRRSWRLISYPFTATAAPTINASIQEGAGGNASSNPNPGYGAHITGGTTANGFDANPSGNPSMRQLSGSNWIGITSTNVPITSNTAYFIFVRGSRANNLSMGVAAPVDNTTLRGTGNIKQGNQSISLSGTGWQLVGNPFPSPVNLAALATTNSSVIHNNFTFWDPKLGGSNNVGGYVTASYNGSGYDYVPVPVSSLSEFVQSGAAFFVDAKGAGTLNINEVHKSSGGSDYVFRPSASPATLRVNIKSFNNDGTQPIVDGVMASFGDYFNNTIDEQDAPKMRNSMTENLSIKKDSTLLSIERKSSITSNDTVQLNLNYMRVRSYQLELDAAFFDTTTIAAYLEDVEANTITPINLSGITTYNFSITPSFNPNRLRIIMRRNMIVLPVTLTHIAATRRGKNAEISWSVENQVNLSRYEIERSADGNNFTKAGEKRATGTLNSSYNWTDEQANNNLNFYRIKMIDENGQFKYSKVVYVAMAQQGTITIYPNPVMNNTVQLLLNEQAKGNYKLNIYNSNGQQLTSVVFEFDGMEITKRIKLPTLLLKGIYTAEVILPSGKKTSMSIAVE